MVGRGWAGLQIGEDHVDSLFWCDQTQKRRFVHDLPRDRLGPFASLEEEVPPGALQTISHCAAL